MLTATEKKGCQQILEKLTNEELLSLKDTITRRQINVETRAEAMKAVLSYSQSAAELLRRKKLRRDFIFQYLADNNVVVPATMEKYELIRSTLQYWGSEMLPDSDLLEIEPDTTNNQTELGGRAAEVTAAIAAAPAVASPTAVVPKPTEDFSVQSMPHKHQALAETFVRWFYELINSQNPTHSGGGDVRDFGPHHFWDNCTLKLSCRTPDLSEEAFEGSVLVAQRLRALASEELLIFNPNVSSDGVRVLSDPHGLLIVMVCGTVHQHNKCLGTFQQMFGLVQTPTTENTWKIKTSQLQIHSSQVTVIPKLTDSLARALLPVS